MLILRLFAFALDWLILALWAGLIFGIIMFWHEWNPPSFSSPWQGQAVSFLAMTLPFILYFASCESSSHRSSIGKRIVGLEVSKRSGERLSFSSSLLRNAIKFVPWEFGHLMAHHAAFVEESASSYWIWGPAMVAMLGLLWWLAALFFSGETPYDRWVGAHVTRSNKGETSQHQFKDPSHIP